ncbi:MAG: hypothetical protein RI575_05815 [Balneolaceae bacterium]|nr:hypothetical protein [Balneolaceae bacterium]MDR9408751.1 hypothetical protein [Balneolaceae bacterium]
MKKNIVSLPSVLESHNSPLINVTNERIEGLKLFHDDQYYIVGNLALNEGNSPHKVINCSPDDTDYQVLMKSSLYLAECLRNGKPIQVTTGFPFSTYRMNIKGAKELVGAMDSIIIDLRTIGEDADTEIRMPNVDIDIMPELLASTLAARSGEMGVKGGVFVVSLGYGTLEIGMSTDSGFIQRTFNSGSGIRYAVKSAMNKLEKNYYLGLRNEHQFDRSFRKGAITLNRRRIDLTAVRKEALIEYYKDIVSPLIMNTWTDDDFSKVNTLVLVGGGALYSDLVNEFYEEFNGILSINIPDDPLTMASTGYALNSNKKIEYSGKKPGKDIIPVGIDIGNANSVITLFTNDKAEEISGNESVERLYDSIEENSRAE